MRQAAVLSLDQESRSSLIAPEPARRQAAIILRRMKQRSTGEKWTRMQSAIQEGILKAYPNPQRKGCAIADEILRLADRAARFDNTIESDPHWQHVAHCSPCYRQYLEAFHLCRRSAVPNW